MEGYEEKTPHAPSHKVHQYLMTTASQSTATTPEPMHTQYTVAPTYALTPAETPFPTPAPTPVPPTPVTTMSMTSTTTTSTTKTEVPTTEAQISCPELKSYGNKAH